MLLIPISCKIHPSLYKLTISKYGKNNHIRNTGHQRCQGRVKGTMPQSGHKEAVEASKGDKGCVSGFY